MSIEKYFKKNSVIVFGTKGHGKDLLFQKVINKRKKPYYANMSYGGKYKFVLLKNMTFEPNDFASLIESSFTIVSKDFEESRDFYISDAGNYLPSQYYKILDKKYTGLPLFYSMTRQAFNSNIHVNTQYLGRIWDKLREQADIYIKCSYALNLPFFLFCRVVVYDRYETALLQLEPIPTAKTKDAKMQKAMFESLHGTIKSYHYAILKRHIHYDTREFHFKLFGRRSPNSKYKEPESVSEDLALSVKNTSCIPDLKALK